MWGVPDSAGVPRSRKQNDEKPVGHTHEDEVNPICKRDARISRSIIEAAPPSTASTSVEYRYCRIARPSV